MRFHQRAPQRSPAWPKVDNHVTASRGHLQVLLLGSRHVSCQFRTLTLPVESVSAVIANHDFLEFKVLLSLSTGFPCCRSVRAATTAHCATGTASLIVSTTSPRLAIGRAPARSSVVVEAARAERVGRCRPWRLLGRVRHPRCAVGLHGLATNLCFCLRRPGRRTPANGHFKS